MEKKQQLLPDTTLSGVDAVRRCSCGSQWQDWPSCGMPRCCLRQRYSHGYQGEYINGFGDIKNAGSAPAAGGE